MGPNGALAYNKMQNVTGVENADPHRLIQMLIDGSIEKINRAKFFLNQGKTQEKGLHISWAISIINGLNAAVNKDQGGEIATNLSNLYEFCASHLVLANAENSMEKLDEVLSIMQEIKTAWDGIREQAVEELQ